MFQYRSSEHPRSLEEHVQWEDPRPWFLQPGERKASEIPLTTKAECLQEADIKNRELRKFQAAWIPHIFEDARGGILEN